jgi:uncharacterized protein YfaP (DUF2135 family)
MSRRNNGLVATLFTFNDLLWALLACFMVLTALLVTQIKNTKATEKTNDDVTAGNISVYVYWPDGIDLDIDTHLSSPSGDHVFFGKLSGKIWNLLRDDLGMAGDTAQRNFENAYARGLPAGDYVVNIHAYRGGPQFYPVNVEGEVVITANPSAGKGSQKIVKQTVTLYRTGEETTLVRFTIDGQGNVVPGSVNHIFKSLVRPE